MVKKTFILILFLILICPYILLFKNVHFTQLNWKEFQSALENTFIQSTFSAIAAIAFGMWASLGLCYLRSKKEAQTLKYFNLICLVPSFLPSLFFVTAILQIVRPFPFGLTGIILIHTLSYVGLVALLLHSIIENKFYSLSEQAYLEGASQFHFLKAVVKNMSFEIFMIFIFLFVQFFTSFSVPLLVGMKRLTLETLIYEKIRTTGDLSGAMLISLFESVFVVFILIFYRPNMNLDVSTGRNLQILSRKSGLYVLLLPVCLFVAGSLLGSSVGLHQLLIIENRWSVFFPLVIKSVGISLLSGLFLFLCLGLIAYSYKNKYFDKFLLSFIPLSTILIALSLLLVHLHFGFMEQDIKVVLAMSILLLPVLYRFELKTKLYALESQMEVASLMGASGFLSFTKIVFPQIFPSLLFLAGLGAFWTIGDFAISQIIYGKDITLALYIQSLVGSYKLELANLLMLVLMVLGLFVFLIFREMKYVVDKKN
jgi:thiamine transport system permease protein